MNLTITPYYYNTNFKAGKKSDVALTNLLSPMVEALYPCKKMAQESGLNQSTIRAWFENKYGMSYSEYYRIEKEKKLHCEFSEYKKRGLSNGEIAKIYKKSISWVNCYMEKFGMNDMFPNETKVDKYDWVADAYDMIKRGCTIQQIISEKNISSQKLRAGIKRVYGKSITQIRHENGISNKPNSDIDALKAKLEYLIVEKKYNVRQAAEELGLKYNAVARLIKCFKMKCCTKIYRDDVLGLVKEGVSPEVIAEEKRVQLSRIRNIINYTQKVNEE